MISTPEELQYALMCEPYISDVEVKVYEDDLAILLVIKCYLITRLRMCISRSSRKKRVLAIRSILKNNVDGLEQFDIKVVFEV